MRCTQPRNTTHGLDGQHQDVDGIPPVRVDQNDRGQRQMEKVRSWCGQPSDRGRLKNRTEPNINSIQNLHNDEDQRVLFWVILTTRARNSRERTAAISCRRWARSTRCLMLIAGMHRRVQLIIRWAESPKGRDRGGVLREGAASLLPTSYGVWGAL